MVASGTDWEFREVDAERWPDLVRLFEWRGGGEVLLVHGVAGDAGEQARRRGREEGGADAAGAIGCAGGHPGLPRRQARGVVLGCAPADVPRPERRA